MSVTSLTARHIPHRASLHNVPLWEPVGSLWSEQGAERVENLFPKWGLDVLGSALSAPLPAELRMLMGVCGEHLL